MQHTVYLFEGFQLDVTRRKLISSGGLVQSLNSRAMEALLMLVANAGELVEKRRLMQTVWPNAIVEDNNLNQCILAIRKALGEVAGSNRYIMTVPGRGYRFVSPVRTVTQESASEAAAAIPLRPGSIPALWPGMLGATCIVLLVLLLASVARGPAKPLVSILEVAAAPEEASPGIVLRLRASSTAGDAAADRSASLLTQCLMAKPSMKLRVQLQLMEADGAPVWIGEYLAGAQDLLGAPVGTGATAAGYRELVVVGQAGQRKVSVAR